MAVGSTMAMNLGQRMKINILVRAYCSAKERCIISGESAYDDFYKASDKLDNYNAEIFEFMSKEEVTRLRNQVSGSTVGPKHSNQAKESKQHQDAIDDNELGELEAKSKFMSEKSAPANQWGCQQELL